MEKIVFSFDPEIVLTNEISSEPSLLSCRLSVWMLECLVNHPSHAPYIMQLTNQTPIKEFKKPKERSAAEHLICERFEPRSHFKSKLSLIVRVNVVQNRTVVVESD